MGSQLGKNSPGGEFQGFGDQELAQQIGRLKLLEYWHFCRFSWTNSSQYVVGPKRQICNDVRSR